jgi:hypothetical protein
LAIVGLAATLLPTGGLRKPDGNAAFAAPMAAPRGHEIASADALANVEQPPSLGQPEFAVFVKETGHSLRGMMLDYWRATGGAAVYGNPISEPFAANGLYSQAFERGIFQYRPDVVWTVEPIMRLLPIGKLAVREQAGTFRADGKRASGGGDRRAGLWRAQRPDAQPVARTVADGGVYVEATGHTIAGTLLGWYQQHEGDYYLGNPLSEPLRERGKVAQWFEGGLLLAEGDEARLAPLPRERATTLGIDTSPIPQDEIPDYDESLFWVADNPNPLGDMSKPGPKRIEVSISQQMLFAYQGNELVMTAYVSTGIAPNTTEQGRFRVRYKVLTEDMRGATDANGNVVWVVGDGGAPPPGSIPYGVTDVPHVMYVNLDAEALHGAYWHNSFGIPMSHGCINLPLNVAAFLYGWAPLGTEVLVYQ